MTERLLTRRDFIRVAGATAGVAAAEFFALYAKPLRILPSGVAIPNINPSPEAVFQSNSPVISAEPTTTPIPSKEPTVIVTPSPTSENAPMQELAKIKPGEVIYTADTHRKIICLTIDDGFSKANMKKIMNAANKRGVKISFLPIGRVIAQDPGLYMEIIDSGHEIGNHTQHHSDLTRLSIPEIKDEILRARDALWKAAGREIPQNLLRPPGGAFNKHTIQAAAELGYGILMWDVTSAGTSKYATVKSIEKRVESGLHNGAIILQHPTPYDTAAFPAILDYALSEGFKPQTVSEGLK